MEHIQLAQITMLAVIIISIITFLVVLRHCKSKNEEVNNIKIYIKEITYNLDNLKRQMEEARGNINAEIHALNYSVRRLNDTVFNKEQESSIYTVPKDTMISRTHKEA